MSTAWMISAHLHEVCFDELHLETTSSPLHPYLVLCQWTRSCYLEELTSGDFVLLHWVAAPHF